MAEIIKLEKSNRGAELYNEMSSILGGEAMNLLRTKLTTGDTYIDYPYGKRDYEDGITTYGGVVFTEIEELIFMVRVPLFANDELGIGGDAVDFDFFHKSMLPYLLKGVDPRKLMMHQVQTQISRAEFEYLTSIVTEFGLSILRYNPKMQLVNAGLDPKRTNVYRNLVIRSLKELGVDDEEIESMILNEDTRRWFIETQLGYFISGFDEEDKSWQPLAEAGD